jgi:ABC-type sugar transport system permease subunit
VLYLYNAAFKLSDFSLAATVGVILFVIILTATLIQRRFLGRAPDW